MKKHILVPTVITLVLLTGCNYNDDNFEGLKDAAKPANVMSLDYTLTETDYDAIGDFAKANKYLLSVDQADNYFPAWLLKKYYAADPTSVVRVTFNCATSNSDLNVKYAGLDKNEDYSTIHGEGKYAPFLNTATENDANLIACLLAKGDNYKSPKEGDIVIVGYDFNDKAVIQNGSTPVLGYDFEEISKTGDVTSLSGGWYLSAPDDCKWKVYSDKVTKNQYAQFSAYKTTEETIGWLITPAIEIEGNDKKFAFDVVASHWNADCLSVLISTDFDGKDVAAANWVDVTSNFATKNNSLGSAGTMSLSDYAGKKIRIAFKYVGDGANNKTTTYQIDNVVVGKDIVVPVSGSASKCKVFVCQTAGTWAVAPATSWIDDVHYMTDGDYALFGLKNMRFDDSNKPESYLPTKVKLETSNAMLKDGATKTIIYRYYSNEVKTAYARASVFKYSAVESRWIWNGVHPVVRQYAFDGTKWMFDPSTTIILKAKDDATKAFYQYITDWVKDNKGTEYVTSYGNNDYYYGGSAYNNNFDFRPASWKAQNAVDYGEKSNDELNKIMYGRLPEAFIPGLEHFYGDAAPVEGVNVIYTVNFSIYDGSATKPWTIQYEVKEKGKFTYIEDSLKEVK